jgi:hypothetical protein
MTSIPSRFKQRGNFNIGTLFGRGAGPSTGSGQPVPGGGNQGPQPGSGGMQKENSGAGEGAPGGAPAGTNNGPGGGAAGDDHSKGGGNANEGGSPLDAFKDIFTVDPKAQAPADPFAEPLFKFDAAKTKEAFGKMNFTGAVAPELIQKAMGGDQQAFSTVMNQVGQTVMQQAFQMFTGMSEAAFKSNNSRWDGAIGSKIKTSMLGFSRPENSVLSHAAVSPVVEALKTSMAANPANAGKSPQEIAKLAEDYFLAMADAIGASKKTAEGTEGAGGDGAGGTPDWTKFLG